MKRILIITALSFHVAAQAVILNFDLSPTGTDNAVGLSPLNEVPAVTNSTGSGNEIGTGITFDTDTLILTLNIGYGSAFGFSDLTGPATGLHIHGPAPTNTPAGVIINLAANHVAATNPAAGGLIAGTVIYGTNQVADLLAGLHYINIHTATNPGGEIRAQLIPVNNPPLVTCPLPAVYECNAPGGRLVNLAAQVSDADGNALTVVWSVDGVSIQTNAVAAGTATNPVPVTLSAFLSLGQHQIQVAASDGVAGTSCITQITIADTMPPVIVSATANPSELWPPNHKMKPVTLSVVATDACSTVTCKIKSVASSEPSRGQGKKDTGPDWAITGNLSVKLRAERYGNGDGRTYTITVECSDTSTNTVTRDVIVTVPHDQGNHSGQASNPDKTNPGQTKQNGNSQNSAKQANAKNSKKSGP